MTLQPTRQPAFARNPSPPLTGALEAGRKSLRTHVLALADQAVVSGTSFLTFILVSHWTNPSQLGVYSIGISVLVSALAVQHSMVLLPYIIERFRPLGTVAEHAGTSLIQSGLLSLLGMALFAGTALCLSVWGVGSDTTGIAWALAAALPFAMLREFARRYAFSRLQMGEALLIDLAISTVQFASLYWLGSTGRLSPATACAAQGAACALAGILWLYLRRSDFIFRRDQTATAARQSWTLGKWFLAGQVTVSLQGYATYWLLALMHGTAATGVYAACMSLAAFGNPLMLGINNALGPKAVLALETGGEMSLRRQTVRGAVLQAAAMSVFCIVLALGSTDAMRLVYRGQDFDGQGATVALLGFGLLALAVGSPAQFSLATLGAAHETVRSYALGLVFTIFLGLLLMSEWSLFGAACGYAAGCVAATIGLWTAFLTRSRGRSSRSDSNKRPFSAAASDPGQSRTEPSSKLIMNENGRLAGLRLGGRSS